MTSAEQAYLFRHALLRDAAYQIWTPHDRARMHLFAAEGMAELLGRAPTEALAVAAHFRAAGSEIDDPALPAAEASWLDIGAAHAWRVYDHTGGIAALQRLRDLVTDAPARAGVALRLASALDRVGRMGEAGDAAMECSRLSGKIDERASALARASYFFCACDRRPEALAALEELERLAVSGGRELEQEAESARGLYCFFGGDMAGAGRHQTRALELGRALGMPETELLSDISNLAALHLDMGELDQAEELGQQALAIARQHGKLEMQALALSILGDTAARRMDVALAEKRYRQGLSAAQQSNSPTRVAQAHYHLGLRLLGVGRLHEAHANLSDALPWYEERGNPVVACHIHYCRARIWLWLGRHADAASEVEAMTPQGPRAGTLNVLPVLARVMRQLALDNHAVALELLGELPAPAYPPEAAAYHHARARALAAAGRHAQALSCTQQALETITNEPDLPADRLALLCLHAWLLHTTGQVQPAIKARDAAHAFAQAAAIDDSFPVAETLQALALLAQIK